MGGGREGQEGGDICILLADSGFPGDSDGKEPACNAGDPGSIPESGRSPGGGHGYPLRYSCLENPMNRGAWKATHRPRGRTESDTIWLIHVDVWQISNEYCKAIILQLKINKLKHTHTYTGAN